MADANSLDNQIYTGTWVNHSYGRIAGGTLTLTRENGGLLIAFLALFVAAAGRSFWRLTRFILHTIFSSEERRDGVYHQRQAILRNTQIAMDAGLDLMYSRVAWRGRSRSLDGKLTSVAALAITVATVFVVSGAFGVVLLHRSSSAGIKSWRTDNLRYLLIECHSRIRQRSPHYWHELRQYDIVLGRHC